MKCPLHVSEKVSRFVAGTMGRAPVQAGTSRRLSHFGTLAFTRSRIETAFRGAHSQKHAALDPLGFAFALVWCAAIAFCLGCALTSVQQAALAVLTAATAAAAALQQLNAPAYQQHRSLIVSALRLALAAASAAAQPLALQTVRGDTTAAFIVLQAGQLALLAFCALAWRLRLQLHLPVQAACLAAAGATNCRLAAAAVTDPAAAAAVSGMLAALSPTLAAAVSPAAAVAAVTTILQVSILCDRVLDEHRYNSSIRLAVVVRAKPSDSLMPLLLLLYRCSWASTCPAVCWWVQSRGSGRRSCRTSCSRRRCTSRAAASASAAGAAPAPAPCSRRRWRPASRHSRGCQGHSNCPESRDGGLSFVRSS